MANRSEKIINRFRRFLPNPFTIAIILTVLTLLLALVLTKPATTGTGTYFVKLVNFWEEGLWDKSTGGLYFAFQMMLMLVLGHCLALTTPIRRLIDTLTSRCTNTANSAFTVAISAIVAGFFNWGLGLIFGALLVRRIGEKFAFRQEKINYGLIGASAYVTMMVWHGGLSGSAPTKVMEPGYLNELIHSIPNGTQLAINSIPFEATIGSGMNIISFLLLIVIIPLLVYYIGGKNQNMTIPPFAQETKKKEELSSHTLRKGAEQLDTSKWVIKIIGGAFLLTAFYQASSYEGASTFGFIHPNFINLSLFGLCLFLHQHITGFLDAIQKAMGDVSGILIQFPLYFGILGIMKGSGLIDVFSNFMITYSSADTLPFYTFLSAGLVNFFVPSGGGQWAIQGPIILQTATELGADLPKTIMGMAYGDQLTNMLQPFWALPLLGITKLKAYEILPYTLLLFAVGFFIFGLILTV